MYGKNSGPSYMVCFGQMNTLMLGCLACHITAMLQLPHEVNKLLLAYVILCKGVNFRQYFVCSRERIFNCCNVLMWSWSSRSNSCGLRTNSLLFCVRNLLAYLLTSTEFRAESYPCRRQNVTSCWSTPSCRHSPVTIVKLLIQLDDFSLQPAPAEYHDVHSAPKHTAVVTVLQCNAM